MIDLSVDTRFVPDRLHQGIGPIYRRYKPVDGNAMKDEYFPVLGVDGNGDSKFVD